MNKKVIVAEHDTILRQILVDKLARSGYQTIPTSSHGDTISSINSDSPDMAIISLDIDNGSGIKLLEEIRSIKSTGFPIIVIAESRDDSLIEKAKTYGVLDFLSKSEFDSDDVVARVNRVAETTETPKQPVPPHEPQNMIEEVALKQQEKMGGAEPNQQMNATINASASPASPSPSGPEISHADEATPSEPPKPPADTSTETSEFSSTPNNMGPTINITTSDDKELSSVNSNMNDDLNKTNANPNPSSSGMPPFTPPQSGPEPGAPPSSPTPPEAKSEAASTAPFSPTPAAPATPVPQAPTPASTPVGNTQTSTPPSTGTQFTYGGNMQTAPAGVPNTDTTSQTVRKRSIMIVEDDKFLREIAGQKLQDEGFQVYSATTGDEAFQVLAKNKPDIIVLDLILPGMSGFEVLSKLKETQEYREIPVLILSNLGQEEDIEKAKSLGATDYLVKAHFSFAEIIKKIREILG